MSATSTFGTHRGLTTSSTQFMESVDGLATIRAFRWQVPALERNQSLVDRAQKPFYLLSMAQKWLALVLDLIVTALAVLVVGVVVALRDIVSLGFSGVSLIQIISITGYLRLLILFWTQLETSLGAVMRIKQFCESTPDENLDDSEGEVPIDWPATGDISLRSVSVSYRYVLRFDTFVRKNLLIVHQRRRTSRVGRRES